MRIGIASHIVLDKIEGADGTIRESLGGPPCYAGLTCRQFGFKVSLATRVGRDFTKDMRRFLADSKVELREKQMVEGSTTKFRISTQDDTRSMSIQQKCHPLDMSDIAATNADCWLVSPVFDEISEELFGAIKTKAGPGGFVMLDPQGFMRRVDSEGRVYVLESIDLNLSSVQAIKADQQELRALSGGKVGLAGMRELQSRGVTHVVSTSPGMIHLLHKEIHYWTTIKEIETVDSTGAGDILSGAFCCAYLKEKDPLWAISFGAGAVKAALETGKIGLGKIPHFSAIEENASYFYNTMGFKQLS